MDEPKLTTVIEYNGELFREGDIVNFAIDCGFNYQDNYGRIVEINENETLKFDCSEQCASEIKVINIGSLASISHAAEQEKEIRKFVYGDYILTLRRMLCNECASKLDSLMDGKTEMLILCDDCSKKYRTAEQEE